MRERETQNIYTNDTVPSYVPILTSTLLPPKLSLPQVDRLKPDTEVDEHMMSPIILVRKSLVWLG